MRQHILNSNLKSTSRSPSPEPVEPTHVEKSVEEQPVSSPTRKVTVEDAEEEDREYVVL